MSTNDSGDTHQINKKLEALTREQANELADHLNDAMNAAMLEDAKRAATGTAAGAGDIIAPSAYHNPSKRKRSCM